MKRDYADGIKDNATFFVGEEVEKTATEGMKTLFVVGLQRTASVVRHAEKHKTKHIYFGANHSYKVLDGSEINQISSQLKYFLDKDYHVTIDTNPAYRFKDIMDLLTYPRFTIVYGIRMDNIMDMKGNVVIKLDDADFKATNPGVWCWSVRDMIDDKHFTDWSEYGADETL
jgi:hypothetical protein